MTSNHSVDALNDNALLNQFGDLVQQAHEGSAQLLRHIEAIDRRKLWAKLGYSSLFNFLVGRYHMSESTAGKRMGAARAARRFPILFDMVARGEIHLSGIHRLKAHLTRDNHERVLAEAKHKTIRQIDELVARLAPQPDVPTRLRALPNRTTTAATLAAPATLLQEPVRPESALVASALAVPAVTSWVPAPATPAPVATVPSVTTPGESAPATGASAPAPPPLRRDPEPEPLSPGRYKLTLTISESTRGKIEQLKDLLAHKIPKGDLSVILDRALDALLTEVHKKKTGIGAKPRAAAVAKPTPSGQQTRHVKASARREVWPRDQGRCGFVSEDGHHCNETRGLQFAHRKPYAKGGANTAENLGLRCPAHNALEADRDYGTRFMAEKRKQKQKPLKVRESLARYIVRKELVAAEPFQDSSCVAGTRARSSGLRRTARNGRARGGLDAGNGRPRSQREIELERAPS